MCWYRCSSPLGPAALARRAARASAPARGPAPAGCQCSRMSQGCRPWHPTAAAAPAAGAAAVPTVHMWLAPPSRLKARLQGAAALALCLHSAPGCCCCGGSCGRWHQLRQPAPAAHQMLPLLLPCRLLQGVCRWMWGRAVECRGSCRARVHRRSPPCLLLCPVSGRSRGGGHQQAQQWLRPARQLAGCTGCQDAAAAKLAAANAAWARTTRTGAHLHRMGALLAQVAAVALELDLARALLAHKSGDLVQGAALLAEAVRQASHVHPLSQVVLQEVECGAGVGAPGSSERAASPAAAGPQQQWRSAARLELRVHGNSEARAPLRGR